MMVSGSCPGKEEMSDDGVNQVISVSFFTKNISFPQFSFTGLSSTARARLPIRFQEEKPSGLLAATRPRACLGCQMATFSEPV